MDGSYTTSLQRTLALSFFSTSQPLLCEQLCSIMDSHHDALPHHRPPNNTTERPSTGTSETVSQKCPWFSHSFPQQQKTNTPLSITKLRTPEQIRLWEPNLCSAEGKKASRKEGGGRPTGKMAALQLTVRRLLSITGDTHRLPEVGLWIQ